MFYDFLNTTSHASFIVQQSRHVHERRQRTTVALAFTALFIDGHDGGVTSHTTAQKMISSRTTAPAANVHGSPVTH